MLIICKHCLEVIGCVNKRLNRKKECAHCLSAAFCIIRYKELLKLKNQMN